MLVHSGAVVLPLPLSASGLSLFRAGRPKTLVNLCVQQGRIDFRTATNKEYLPRERIVDTPLLFPAGRQQIRPCRTYTSPCGRGTRRRGIGTADGLAGSGGLAGGADAEADAAYRQADSHPLLSPSLYRARAPHAPRSAMPREPRIVSPLPNPRRTRPRGEPRAQAGLLGAVVGCASVQYSPISFRFKQHQAMFRVSYVSSGRDRTLLHGCFELGGGRAHRPKRGALAVGCRWGSGRKYDTLNCGDVPSIHLAPSR